MKDKNCNGDPFVPIPLGELDKITAILEQRLPRSAHMYNTSLLIKNPELAENVRTYTYEGDLSSNCWIVFIVLRADYWKDVSISAPADPLITAEIKNAFSSSEIFDWGKPYMFTALETTISPMIAEISTTQKLNATNIVPCYTYVMDRAYASAIKIEAPPGVEMRQLNEDKVNVDYFINTWKYALDGSPEYISKVLQTSTASGIFIENQLVSSMLTNFNGLMGMLYTNKEHRGKGLAAICSRHLAKELANRGMVPTSTSEVHNHVSNSFHLKIGMKLSHDCVFVLYYGSKF